MEKTETSHSYDFYELTWDTGYFGINCAKAVLYKPLMSNEWINLARNFPKYDFITIENRNSEPVNAQYIGKDTSSILVDVNIQFKKKLQENIIDNNDDLFIHEAIDHDDRILGLAEFQYSKFIEDPGLAVRGGEGLYRQWILNSFGKKNKFFAVYQRDDAINGFILHSYIKNTCRIELVSISKESKRLGIGTLLFKYVENSAYQKGYQEINVGTQIRNIPAMNFYVKCGCKVVEINQTYHLWNI